MSALRPGRLLVAALAASLAGCGATQRKNDAPPVDAVEPLVQSQKRIENAIAATKALIQRSRNADYVPDLQMRLAELYTEQARYVWLAAYEKRRARGDSGRAIEAPAARILKNLAIAEYDRVLREFPRYGRADEALFLMAHEYRELGEFDSMKSTYRRLIDTFPKSSHRLEAFLILGDTAFDGGNLEEAERNYNAVLAGAESPVHGLARYKLGWVRVNKDDCKGAVGLFEKILRDRSTPRGAKTLVATQRKLDLHREALVDLAYCYPDVTPERPASPYFRSLADNSSDYIAAMRRVAKRFYVKQLYAQAAGALREVLGAATAGEDALEDARRLYDNLIKGKVFDQAAVDVERIGRVFVQHYYDHRLAKDAREKLAAEFEVYGRDLATRAQEAARTAKSTPLNAVAAAAYGAWIDAFPMAAVGVRIEMEQNRAEALHDSEQHLAAGRAFEHVAALMLTEPEPRRQARTSAIASYQQALERGGLSRVERFMAWGGIRAQGMALIGERPDDENVVKVKLAVARTSYDAGDYTPAAELYYAVARQYPSRTEGLAAAHLALDAMRLAENYERLATLGRRMLADPKLGDEKFRAEVAEIINKTEQRQVAEIAISSGGEHQERLLSYARRHKGSGLGEQALYNALVAARADGDLDRFTSLGEEFVEQYPSSKLRIDVMAALASAATDRADFTQAAQYLEQTYRAEPAGKESLARLQAAAEIHAVLGDDRIVEDLRELGTRGASDKELQELLLQTARSGNLTALQQVLGAGATQGPVAELLRGYFAWQRGDRDEAARRLSAVARERTDGDPMVADVSARARFLIGEIVYQAFLGGGETGDLAAAVQEKSDLLAAADSAYAQAIGSGVPRWSIAAIARVADIYRRFSAFLRGVKLPDDVSAAERKQLQDVLGLRADEAQKRAGELKDLCARRAREGRVYSEAVRSCLGEQPAPERIEVLPQRPARRAGDPPGAAELRQSLLKNPKNADSLVKLAELYLGTGDLGMALLTLDRAESVTARSAELHNLRGVALVRSGEPDAAGAEFKKAVELDDKFTQARLNLAAHYASYGYVDEAREELKRAGGSWSTRGGVAEHPDLGSLGGLGEKK